MHVYIAGPMRGHFLYNFPAFFKAAVQLRKGGHVVENPAENDMANGVNPNEPADSEHNAKAFCIHEAFRWDFLAIERAEAIVLLPGWKKSKGVAAELTLALFMGKKLFEYSEGAAALGTVVLREITMDYPTISFRFEEGAN